MATVVTEARVETGRGWSRGMVLDFAVPKSASLVALLAVQVQGGHGGGGGGACGGLSYDIFLFNGNNVAYSDQINSNNFPISESVATGGAAGREAARRTHPSVWALVANQAHRVTSESSIKPPNLMSLAPPLPLYCGLKIRFSAFVTYSFRKTSFGSEMASTFHFPWMGVGWSICFASVSK